ncbi:hypothetical protein [Methanolobus psychrotolerans]|uniref:hypothetical protein n=1 Tax=Methanolobus psychrotolerans TaxID=1874706 RepID=UPI00101AE218|nr:hypothetical protein [Methanolobus psychrotolerans]
MATPDIDTYIEEAEVIEKMYMDLLEGTTQRRMKCVDDGSTGLQNVEYKICVINSKNELLQNALILKYEGWYEACRDFVQEYSRKGMSSKHGDFTVLYEKIVSLMNLKDPTTNSNEKRHLKKEFISCFDTQVNMLRTIGHIIVSSKNSRKMLVMAELVNGELEEAESLYEQGSVRHACIIAGNALERCLKMLCEVGGVELESGDTMFAMAQKLHESNKAYDFGLEMSGIIEHFVALRDKCVNVAEGEELQEDGVRELIDRVRELTFLAFC